VGETFGPNAFEPPLRVVGCRYSETGEQRLMLAVLCDAMHAYAAERVRGKHPGRVTELRQWFESADRSYVFSFESVCDALGLEAAYVRHRVLRHPRLPRRPWAHRVHSHRIVAPRVRHPARDPLRTANTVEYGPSDGSRAGTV
jgi:hypothetical protein